MEIRIPTAEFVTTAVDAASCPPPGAPEVAFVGRSNVGKSSLINALTQRRKLVRVSNTPGRTRALNFFQVIATRGARSYEFRLCDLPGYGYAKISKADRASWEELIETYLRGRASLKAIVQIIDAEIGPTEQDAEMLTWLGRTGREVLLVATKLDRLNKAKRLPALRKHEQTLRLPQDSLLGVSSEERIGLDDLWHRLFVLHG